MVWGSNLLIQIDLFTDEDNPALSKPLRLKLIFMTEDKKIIANETTPETYSGVISFVHLVPELKVPLHLRQFHLKVALVVENEEGPSSRMSALIGKD